MPRRPRKQAQPIHDRARDVRAKKGHGSVYQRASDGRWVATVPLEQGRLTRYARSEDDAKLLYRELTAERDHRLLAATDKQTLGHYLAQWLHDKQRYGALRPHSFATYRSWLGHVHRHLGHVPLGMLTPLHLRGCYADLLEGGMSPTTVHNVHGALSSALKDAVRMDVLPRNPADRVTPPQKVRKNPATIGFGEISRLCHVTEGDRFWALWVLLGTTGMRIGEALALEWSDINWADETVHIQRTTTAIPGGGLTVGPVKTKNANRTLDLDRRAVDALRRQQTDIKKRQLKAKTWSEGDLIFPNEHGRLTQTGVVGKALDTATKKAGLPRLTPHKLRHSFATNALGAGIYVNLVSEILGHSSPRTTLVEYGHTTKRMHREAMALMGQLFDEAEQKEAR